MSKTLLHNVRISFPNLAKPRAFNEDQDPKFSVSCIFETQSVTHRRVEKLINELATEAFKGKKGFKSCLRDASEKEHMDGYEDGLWFINASSNRRPVVYGPDRVVVTPEDEQFPYAGCYANVLVSFWAQNNKYGKRINAELLGVQFVRDGEAFAGGGERAEEDDFEDVEIEDDEMAG